MTSGVPESLSTVYQLPANTLGFVLGKLAPGYGSLGCPKPLFSNTGIPLVSTLGEILVDLNKTQS